ncbi:terpenoid cyclases/protein prenyltransferase alpha-alpha toroid [Aspergillus karnatakaensis]|uniref:terpene cyclase/mutase family protein n=1 Tax=Aspergillus karnatakaensis TaxID=1810916 RepID=UPI003CCCDE82
MMYATESAQPKLNGNDAPTAYLTATLLPNVTRSLQKAAAYSYQEIRDDGHWCAETESNPSCTAEYVLFMHILGLEQRLDREALASWLLSEQQADGSWSLAKDSEGDISMTTEAYLALKLLGLSSDHARMRRARNFALSVGGVARVRMLTRVYLAMVGLFPWKAVPELPAEFILAPQSTPVNIYRMSSWSRGMIVPLLLVRHHEPIYALPNGASASNDYLDELWCNPADKMVTYSPPDWSFARLCFWAVDYLLHFFAFLLRDSSLRSHARRECVRWILDHQDEEGDWAGIYPSMAQSVMALRLEGYSISSEPVQKGIAAVERLAWRDKRGMRIQASISPTWDTALMTVGLVDAGVSRNSTHLFKAMNWVKHRQILKTSGDWQVYRPDLQPGGFCFQYVNRFCPDLDDTAAVIIAILKQDPSAVSSVSVLRATEFLLGLQSSNGGWGAYEVDNNSLFMNKIPFSDMDCLSDPPTADVTGRAIEAFGLVLESCRPGNSLSASIVGRIHYAVARATVFLRNCQEPTGAWYGRWGVNYVYGTSNVLCGLQRFAGKDKECTHIQTMVPRALTWLRSVQNSDGGWGESLQSYRDSKYAGVGPSTASQTAWGLMGLLAFLPPTDPAILRGIRYLLETQTVGSGSGASWPEHLFTGVGFPNWFYMKYNFYPHYFPLMALGRWARAMGSQQLEGY